MTYQNNLKKVNQLVDKYKVVPNVQLVAITKYLDLEHTEIAVKSGISCIGENRIQVAEPKINALKKIYPNVTWHFVGRIQKNKAKKIANNFSFIHSIDSWETLSSINKAAENLNKKPNILLQVNIANENNKQGFSPKNIKETIHNLKNYPNTNFKGYMTMAPLVENPEETRTVFQKLKTLAEEISHLGVAYKDLSMGMSNDFKIALEEGATIIRLGTILFS